VSHLSVEFMTPVVLKSFFVRVRFGSVIPVMTRKRFLIGLMMAVLCSTAAAGNLNPFYESLKTEEGSFFAVRPFYSHTVVEEGDLQDVCWPLYSRKSFKDEQTSRALIFWWTHTFGAQEENPRNRNWLLPFYFQGRNGCGENYFAIFPLGGTIYEFLGRDRIAFFLFPLFGKSQINDVKTTSVLWPIYSRTRGEGIRRDRVFPILGKSVLEGSYEKRFVLWPFWTSADYFYPGDSGRTWMLFPLYGRTNLENEKTRWVIPPFFRFTQGTKQNRTYCPWPFIQKIDSEWHEKLYVWPLWGRDRYAGGLSRRTFLFWPFLWSEKFEEDQLTKTRKMALPFFFLEREVLREEGVAPEEQVVVSKGWKVWPLMSWEREKSTSRFRMLELWPITSGPVERNWTPLWTLYKRTNEEGLIRKDVLWFAWHSEREPAANRTEWSLLKGLLSYKREDDARRFRVFWFNLGQR